MLDVNNESNCSYYTTNEINEFIGRDKLLILHHNIRSFNRNFAHLSLLIDDLSPRPDIIVLSETWFTENTCDEIEGYAGNHLYRTNRSGGGISIYVRIGLEIIRWYDYDIMNGDLEMCAVEVILDPKDRKNSYIILGSYRPPNGSLTNFTNRLENIISCFRSRSIIVCGDLNIDLFREDINSDVFNNIYSLNFTPLIDIPTRVTDLTASCIDHIWFNRLNTIISGCIVSDITDHYPIFCVLNVKVKETFIKTYRIHSEDSIDSLCSDVHVMCEKYFNECSSFNVHARCSWFIDNLYLLYDHNCPLKTKTISAKSLLSPWISQEIKRMANFKHKLFKQYKRGNTSFEVYNSYKNNLNSKIRSEKRNYFTNKFNMCSDNIKETWRNINKILSKPKKKSNKVTLRDSDGKLVDSNADISNMFCNYFSSVANNLDSQIPHTNKNPLDYLPNPIDSSFHPSPASASEVKKLLLSFKNKPCHHNSIPVYIFKKIANIIAPVIADIFNVSLNSGVFPNCLKTARVIPLSKSKISNLVENFRPISLLPLMSKILEKLLKCRCTNFINDNNILYERQFGFRSGFSTTDAILHYVDDCVSALDERLYTVTVFLDFSKAFDTINNDILLNKLDRLGFRGNVNNLLRSFLSDRGMFVSANGCDSTVRTMNIGVPQGSVSAAWLFSLYINDMNRSSERLKFVHYADDTVVYRSGSDLIELCNDVCEGLREIDEWLNVNRLSLNVEKTYFMVHTHSNFNVDDCKIEIRGKQLKYVRSTKFLGLNIDDCFNYNMHMSNLLKQLSKVKGIFYRLSNFIPSVIVRKIYYALFYSRMTYGISVWGGGNITNISKLDRLNNGAINVFKEDLPSHVSIPMPFKNVYILNVLNLFYKYANDDRSGFYSRIAPLIPNHDHATRFSIYNSYFIPHVNKTLSQKQFLFNAIKLWNVLPENFKNTNQDICFKTRLKAYLLNLN